MRPRDGADLTADIRVLRQKYRRYLDARRGDVPRPYSVAAHAEQTLLLAVAIVCEHVLEEEAEAKEEEAPAESANTRA